MLALIAAIPAVAGCGDGPTPAATPSPAEEATPSSREGLPVLGQASQDLEFAGVVNGVMTYATAQCVHIRGTTPEKGRFQMAIEGSVDGKNHRLRIVVNGFIGPGTYSWDGIPGSGPEVTGELDSTYSGHATVTVDDPPGSGEVEVFLTKGGEGRIYGLFECPGIAR